MRLIMASAAVCALLSPLPIAAQSDNSASNDGNVHRNDLPETHDGVELPELSEDATSGISSDLQQPLTTVSAGALAAQQYGNVAAAKYADGAVRDLGDRMVLLNQAINDRLDAVGEQSAMSDDVRADLDILDDLNGEDFNQLFATWVTSVYPTIVDAWSQLGEDERFADLAQAVTPQLEEQMATAQNVLDGEIDVPQSGSTENGDSGATGAEGQTGERQHTPEPEQPEVQSGENYEHEQVDVDPQSETDTLPGNADRGETVSAAGELDIVNPAIVFALIEDPSTELEQLEQASDFEADQVRVVSLDEHLEESELDALDDAVSEHESHLSEARDAVESRQVLSDALGEADASVEDLVAFDVMDEGIVLYTRSGQQAQ